jgi:DNA-binding MarR family transcriptional regulator
VTEVNTAGDALEAALNGLQRLLSTRGAFTYQAAAAGIHLSQQSMQVLRAVADEPGRQVNEVARAARMDVGAVSRQLRVLEDDGLVARRTSPGNASVVLVDVTEPGSELARRFRDAGHRHLGAALAEWTPAERAELARLLERLVHDLRATPWPAALAGLATSPAETRH